MSSVPAEQCASNIGRRAASAVIPHRWEVGVFHHLQVPTKIQGERVFLEGAKSALH